MHLSTIQNQVTKPGITQGTVKRIRVIQNCPSRKGNNNNATWRMFVIATGLRIVAIPKTSPATKNALLWISQLPDKQER